MVLYDKFYLLFTTGLIMCIIKNAYCDWDNGFGENIDWAESLEKGLEIAKARDKPLMVIIHKSWCGACKSLKPKFAESTAIQELSKYFVMVNILDEEPSSEFSPDGGYIPRIIFTSSSGEVLKEFTNEFGNEAYKYFYSQPDHIVLSMKKVLKQFNIKPKSSWQTEEL